MSRSVQSVDDKAALVIAAGKLAAGQRAPYFRHIIAKLVMRACRETETFSVSKGSIMRYNPELVAGLKKDECAACILHEASHVWNKHAERVLPHHDGVKANEAQDRAINPPIVSLGIHFPFKVLMPADIGQNDGLAWEEYYNADKSPPKSGGGQMGANGCGSCTGRPHPAEGANGDAEDPEARSPGEMARAAKAVSAAMVEHAAKRRGSVPGGWLLQAEGHLAPPQVPWERQLAFALRSACSFRAGQAVHRFDGPSRRQAGLGYRPGTPMLPRLRAPVPNVALVLDTSGSMSKAETLVALEESKGIIRAAGGDALVMVCDAAVHGVARVRNVKDAAAMLKGGGGSDFRPAFDALERQRQRPDVAVFLTDGEIRVPETAPPMRVIWVVIDGPSPASWGTTIHISTSRGVSP